MSSPCRIRDIWPLDIASFGILEPRFPKDQQDNQHHRKAQVPVQDAACVEDRPVSTSSNLDYMADAGADEENGKTNGSWHPEAVAS